MEDRDSREYFETDTENFHQKWRTQVSDTREPSQRALDGEYPADLRTPYVELLSHTANPVGLLYAVEKTAKSLSRNPYLTDAATIQRIHDIRDTDPMFASTKTIVESDPLFKELNFSTIEEYQKDIIDWSTKVMQMQIPIAEQVSFNFRFSNVSIAFREQLVRHRTAAYWVTVGRTMNYGSMYDNQSYHIPESIKEKGMEDKWNDMFQRQQELYKELVAAGVSTEDSREIIGNAVSHRVCMAITLRALMDMIKTRCCHIIQPHWSSVVTQIVLRMREVDPVFSGLGTPPCMSADRKFIGCKFLGFARERFVGADPLSVCPLWYARHKEEVNKPITYPNHPYDQAELDSHGGVPTVDMMIRAGKWDVRRNAANGKLWNLDLDTK